MTTRLNGNLTRAVKVIAIIVPLIALASILVQQGRQVERLDRLNTNMETALDQIAALKLQGMRNEIELQALGEDVHAHWNWATDKEKAFDDRVRELERKRP